MGVIRNFDQLKPATLEDDWIYLSSDGEESSPNANHLSEFAASPTRRRHQRSKKATMPEPTFKALGVKGKSHKKFRRYANANLAMTEFGSLVNETELEAVSIDDFITQTTSPFAMLLQKLDHVMEFNEFINCTEDQQRDLIGQDIELEHCSFTQKPSLEGVDFVEKDSRQCFSRIDSNIRKQLVKKNGIPLGILASIESKIVQFFQDNPDSMYEANFKCSFKRFLLHATCQYLNLNCQSVDQNGLRLSYVKNKKKHFSQPMQLLSEYLEVIL